MWAKAPRGRLDKPSHPDAAGLVPFALCRGQMPANMPPMQVGLVTPSYQQGRFLGQAIASVVAQGEALGHYAIYDSVSTDATPEVLDAWRDHPKVNTVVVEKDKGQADALNRGLAAVPCALMGWLNADDVLVPGALAWVVEFFERHPEVDVLAGARRIITGRGVPLLVIPATPQEGDERFVSSFFNQEATFWRRSAYERAGGHVDASLYGVMDYELFLRLQLSGARVAYTPRVLGRFRWHGENKTREQAVRFLEEINTVNARHGVPPMTRAEQVARTGAILRRHHGYWGKAYLQWKRRLMARVL